MPQIAKTLFLLFSLPFLIGLPASLQAQTPTDLSAWEPWIKQGNPQWECAFLSKGTTVCTWPGKIRYQLEEQSGLFEVNVLMLAEGSVPVPSSPALYPKDLRVEDKNGKTVAVQSKLENSILTVELPRGEFTIRGSFKWDSLPSELPLPSHYGLFELAHPNRDLNFRRGTQSVWIEQREAGRAAEQLSISVFRKIEDAIPLRIETLIRLRVSGTNRALNLGEVIPPDTTPIQSWSELPHYLSSDGSLGLQLVPGEHEIRIIAIARQPVVKLGVPKISHPEWPKEEIWAFFDDPTFRSVSISGASPVQAALTQLPTEWSSGATYAISSGGELHFEVLRRGEQEPAKNSIHLSREFWPDLDGSGFTVRDVFSGQMNKDFRLNALPETAIGRALDHENPAPITQDPGDGSAGIELRDTQLAITTVSRLSDRGSFSAVGWNIAADSLHHTLHLPPSWLLFHVSGANSHGSTWVESWSLLDIFIALLIVLGSFKLFGWQLAAVVGSLLLLGHNEFIAPRIFLIYVLIFFVWQRLATGRGRGWEIASSTCLIVTFAALVLQSLSFAKLQFIQMLFPQLQSGTRYTTAIQGVFRQLESSLFVWPFLLVLAVIIIFAVRSLRSASGVWNFILRLMAYGAVFLVVSIFGGPLAFHAGYLPNTTPQATYRGGMNQVLDSAAPLSKGYVGRMRRMQSESAPSGTEADSKAETFSFSSKNLVSGPAVPAWKWRSHHLAVPGPVGPEYKVSVYLFSPWVTRSLCALRVFSALTLLVLLFHALGYLHVLRPYLKTASGLTALLLALPLLTPSPVRADYPPSGLLKELESRIQKDMCTSDTCATIEQANLHLRGSEVTLHMLVASDGRSAVTLPGPMEVFLPSEVKRNGEATLSLRRTSGGYLQVQTESGRNILEVTGILPLESSFSLQFETRPLVTEVQTEDWFIEGLSPSGFVQESLRFTRKSGSSQDSNQTSLAQASTPADLPSWFVVSREIFVNDEIRSSIEIQRIGTLGKPVQVKIPLLTGERITSGAATVENGTLLVRFGAMTESLTFGGELPYSGELTLRNQEQKHLSERWTVRCSPIMHCQHEGLQPTHSVFGGKKASVWLPFPGEEVSIRYQDLSSIKGDFLTIDKASYDVNWGAQQLSGAVEVTLRATEQATLKLTAPVKSRISKLTLAGVSGNITGNEGTVLLGPGEHIVSMEYSMPWQAGLFESVPAVSLSAPAHNVSIQVRPSHDRWLIWTGGVSWGPSVLFWGKLIFIVMLCVALAMVSLLPMRPVSAALLGMGLTSVPIVWMMIPLAWLISLKLIPLMRMHWVRIVKPLRLGFFVALSILALIWFFKIVQSGLVLQPPMLVVGNLSNASELKWYVDHAQSTLPQPWVISLPMWCWRVFSLAWSTWLVLALFSWLRLAVNIEAKSEND